ncbi:DUF2637 domain-containing protein [Pseudonocardia sp. MH-G8]|uniref:DUF2637 domain-containing protein n=1 Tax=Pseudonocardia sp. MH-G8 TaxID=1854588 RepID=UPI000BA046F6|nr:DUF2637 domain-containing protein [Pseudonocardia sp. MH-G8]OZM79919.1 hypothetical protein CFP66_23230 [Pseudonocardia sp. MH-G8]
MSTSFYDVRAERRVAAAVADEHRAAAAERLAAAETARETARIEASARAAELEEQATERAQVRKAAAKAARAQARRDRMAARRARGMARWQSMRAGAPGWGMAALWAAVIVAPLLLTWTAQTAFAAEQLGIPVGMAWLFPLAVETGAWVCAFEAHRRTRDGRPVGSLPAWMWLLAGVAAGINFAHGVTGPHGAVAGLALAVLSVLGVLLHHVRQSLDRATRAHGEHALTALRGRAARWVWHPLLSLRACSIAARTDARPDEAWAAAHLDRYGVGPDASRRDRRVGRVIARRQWKADRTRAKADGFITVGGIILALPPTEITGKPATATVPASPNGTTDPAPVDNQPDTSGTADGTEQVAAVQQEQAWETTPGLSPRAIALLARARTAIAAGDLPARPSAHAIRKQFGGSSDTAQAVRDALAATAHDRPTTGATGATGGTR